MVSIISKQTWKLFIKAVMSNIAKRKLTPKCRQQDRLTISEQERPAVADKPARRLQNDTSS